MPLLIPFPNVPQHERRVLPKMLVVCVYAWSASSVLPGISDRAILLNMSFVVGGYSEL